MLGAGIKGERVTLTLANRLNKAIEYHNANPESIIIVSGGQGRGEAISEAFAMKRYLVAHNIDEAKSTWRINQRARLRTSYSLMR